MKNVFIYCGVPGSGKSTTVRQQHPTATVCSADDYVDYNNFDPATIPRAHQQCLQRFVTALQAEMAEIVVDNANCSAYEVAPYAALAQAYGYTLLIRTLRADPLEVAERNTHGVPFTTVCGMAERLTKRELPPWWPQEDVVVHV